MRGFTHVLTNERIHHVLKEHGSASQEASRGQIAVSIKDFARVPEIVRRPDRIALGSPSRANGQPRLVFTKAIDGVTFTYIGEVLRAKRRIEMVSMWKK